MNSSLTDFKRALSRRGYRFTAARKEVLSALVSAGGHVSADELVELVHHSGSDVGRMTVYRTLDLLTELALVRPIYQGTGAAHFVLLVEGHHHHLVCTNCDSIVELDACLLTDIEQRLVDNTGFEIRGHLLEIFGLCRQCRGPQGKASRGDR